MKKLDKLVLKAFWGPFVVALSVVVFIFLMKVMMNYIDDFVSKDVELIVLGKLFSYFALSTIPTALPLALLLGSLMAYGNLGEFFELTALKSAGVSMVRIMAPLFVTALLISGVSFFFSDRVVPWANLKAYSLLYDIRTAKATMKIKEGIFYNDLPGYSIKVNEKLPDGETMLGMLIYKHDSRSYERGNTQVILADSGKMYTTEDNSHLVFELYNGTDYQDVVDGAIGGRGGGYSAGGIPPMGPDTPSSFLRNSFDSYKLVISLQSFGLKRTDEEQFKSHAYMKNAEDLMKAKDSVALDYEITKSNLFPNSKNYYNYNFKTDDSTYLRVVQTGTWVDSLLAIPVSDSLQKVINSAAFNSASSIASSASSNQSFLKSKKKDGNTYALELHLKFARALACLIMCLIGAPLGAIIKKGGFGVPVLISIIFYIFMYVLNIQGEKYVRERDLTVWVGAWLSNMVLLVFGLYFSKQAKDDSRLFDKDVYVIFFQKHFGKYFNKNKTHA